MTRLGLAAVIATILLAARSAEAFCGFYVSPGDAPLLADATQVVLMRKGTRTVLSMQNNYKGPPEAFALVIPVPTVLQEPDVKTLPKDVFGRVDAMGAPRLVEYWEQDPCQENIYPPAPGAVRFSAEASAKDKAGGTGGDFGVTVEAQFEV